MELVGQISKWVVAGQGSIAFTPEVAAMRLVSRAVKEMVADTDNEQASRILEKVLYASPSSSRIIAELGDSSLLRGATVLDAAPTQEDEHDPLVGDAGIASINTLLALCPQLKSLSIGAAYCALPLDRLRFGSGHAKLERVAIHCIQDPSAACGLDLRVLPALREVTLSGTETSDSLDPANPAHFSILLGLPLGLTSLTLRDLNLDVSAIRALRLEDRPTLLYLDLSDNPLDAAGAALLSIASNTTLRQLYLERTALSDDGVAALGFAQNSGIQQLDLGYNTITSTGVRSLALSANKTLQDLCLCFNSITDPTSLRLAENSALRKLDITFNPLDDLDFELGANTALNKLELTVVGDFTGDAEQPTNLTEAHLTRFSRSIAVNSHLEDLCVTFDTLAGDTSLLPSLSLAGSESLRRVAIGDTVLIGEAAFETLGLGRLPVLEEISILSGTDRTIHASLASRIKMEMPGVKLAW